MSDWTLAGRAQLSAGERRRIESLQHACEAAEPVDLKIELDEADGSGGLVHFLAEADGDVIGYAGITLDRDAEACGMVHPAWRRRGVATGLLDEVRGAARRLEREAILVICEDSAPIALAWMRRVGAMAVAAERRMTVSLSAAASTDPPAAVPIEVRVATDDDRAALLSLLGNAFAETPDEVARRIDTGPDEETLVGIDATRVVGTLRITRTARRSMIYGFVVDKDLRGQRLGTGMLAAAFERLRAEGVTDLGLEVDPDNTPAVRLYEAFGFETVTTYRYMRLPVAPAS
jgi:ribosomal protein S18 acetylase RimI-like enzyme